MARVNVLVIRAAGINCEAETLHGWHLAGADTALMHINELLAEPAALARFSVLTIPGGFSYGDDVSAGAILGQRMALGLSDAIQKFVDKGNLVLGICNGFQVLVKMGLLPGWDDSRQRVTITNNASARFEDRWVRLAVGADRCPFLNGMDAIELPLGHAEGRVAVDGDDALKRLQTGGHIALRYVDADGNNATYPGNPNGSIDAIAGLIDTTGRVMGLMPHPDRYLDRTQHPLWTRRPADAPADGVTFFQNAVQHLQ